MKITFYRSHKRRNGRGLAPIICRITVNGKRPELSTGVFCTTDKWSRKERRIKAETEAESQDNEVLINLEKGLRRIKDEIEGNYECLDAELIKSLLELKIRNPVAAISFVRLSEIWLDMRQRDVKEKILKQTSYNEYANKLQVFQKFLQIINEPDLPAYKVDETITERLLHQFIVTQELSRSYANYVIRLAKRVLKLGKKKKIINENPLQDIELRTVKVIRRAPLTRQQREAFINLNFKDRYLYYYKDRGMLQLYTGCSNSDLPKLKKENIIQATVNTKHGEKICDYFYFFREKQRASDPEGELVVFELFPEARAILDRYNWDIPRMWLSAYNRNLRIIGKLIGLPRPLSSHILRKSYGQMMLDKGYDSESVARMMGHDNPETTRDWYVTIGLDRIIKEKERLGC